MTHRSGHLVPIPVPMTPTDAILGIAAAVMLLLLARLAGRRPGKRRPFTPSRMGRLNARRLIEKWQSN